jgi:hypothetical protein
MNRTEPASDDQRPGRERQDAAQRRQRNGQGEPATPQADTHEEAREWSRETGYQPSVNQRRHEPLPASRHDDRRQEAVVRNEEHAGPRTQAAPSRQARRDDG